MRPGRGTTGDKGDKMTEPGKVREEQKPETIKDLDPREDDSAELKGGCASGQPIPKVSEQVV